MALMGWFVGVISVSQESMEDAVLSFTDWTGWDGVIKAKVSLP